MGKIRKRLKLKRQAKAAGLSNKEARKYGASGGKMDGQKMDAASWKQSRDTKKAAAQGNKISSTLDELKKISPKYDKFDTGKMPTSKDLKKEMKSPDQSAADILAMKKKLGISNVDAEKEMQLRAIDQAGAAGANAIDAGMASRGLYSSGAAGNTQAENLAQNVLPAKAGVEKWAAEQKLAEGTRDLQATLGQQDFGLNVATTGANLDLNKQAADAEQHGIQYQYNELMPYQTATGMVTQQDAQSAAADQARKNNIMNFLGGTMQLGGTLGAAGIAK